MVPEKNTTILSKLRHITLEKSSIIKSSSITRLLPRLLLEKLHKFRLTLA